MEVGRVPALGIGGRDVACVDLGFVGTGQMGIGGPKLPLKVGVAVAIHRLLGQCAVSSFWWSDAFAAWTEKGARLGISGSEPHIGASLS